MRSRPQLRGTAFTRCRRRSPPARAALRGQSTISKLWRAEPSARLCCGPAAAQRRRSPRSPTSINYQSMKNGVDLVISRAHILFTSVAIVSVGAALWQAPGAAAQNSGFRNAPASAAEAKNPYKSASAAAAGQKLYLLNCAQCHGSNRQGIGPAPSLDRAPIQNAKPGELFWFITKGKLESGMPSWANLSQQQRWQ